MTKTFSNTKVQTRCSNEIFLVIGEVLNEIFAYQILTRSDSKTWRRLDKTLWLELKTRANNNNNGWILVKSHRFSMEHLNLSTVDHVRVELTKLQSLYRSVVSFPYCIWSLATLVGNIWLNTRSTSISKNRSDLWACKQTRWSVLNPSVKDFLT